MNSLFIRGLNIILLHEKIEIDSRFLKKRDSKCSEDYVIRLSRVLKNTKLFILNIFV